ncbi:MFS transporter, partial [Achromobacter insuavis]|uniref:MFS transporter n=1 Tax=Achromobacter insuavis TaxID=1287735 RepID=UPI0035A085F0
VQRAPHHALYLLLSAAMLGVQLWLFMWAPLHGRALLVSLGYFLLPLVLVLAGRVVFGEKLSGAHQVATALAAAGVGFEVWRTGTLSWEMWLVALGYTAYFVLRRRLRTDHLAGHWLDMALLVPAALFFMLRPPVSLALVADHPALWALLPLLAYDHEDGNALLYGYMLGALGVGAILGSAVVRRLQAAWGASGLVSVAAGLLAACLLILGLTSTLWLAFPALLVSGACWIGVLATYNTTVQMLVPDWVKARSLALYQTAIFGGLAAGSFMWGHFAGTMGVSGALSAAGVMLAITVALLYRSRLPEQVNTQSLARADTTEPALSAAGFNTQHGAVLVAVEYLIPKEKLSALIDAARPLRLLRLRNGAQQWQLFRDLEREGVWREVFLVESWMQYLRMIDRMTLADKMVLDGLLALHDGDKPPVVSRNVSYLAMNEAQGFSLRREPESL